MTSFNRFLLILIAISIVLFWAGLIMLIWTFPDDLAFILRQMSNVLRLQPTLLQIIVTGIGGSAIAVSFLILLGELFPKEETELKVNNVQGGQAVISTQVVVSALKQALEQHPGLQAARPTIVQRRDGVEVSVELHADLDGALAPRAAEVVQIVRNLIESTWGLRVKDVKVTFAPSRLNTGGAPRPDQDGDIIVPGLVQRAPPAEEPKPPTS